MNLDRKFRPNRIEDVIGHNDIKEDLKSYLRTGDPPHMMFVGPPGIGKNTLAYAFATEYLGRDISLNTEEGDRDYKEINASKDRGIDVVREVIQEFAETDSNTYTEDGKRIKRICILDEVDSTTKQFQLAMRSIMEKYEYNCIFILLMNNINGIVEEALFSRCSVFIFTPPNVDIVADYFKGLAYKVGVHFTSDELIKSMIKHYKCDMRRMLVDCLEALRGYTHKTIEKYGEAYILIDEEDLWKIFKHDTQSYAIQIFNSGMPRDTFRKLWEKENFDVRRLLADYHKLLDYQYSRIFAKVDSRLRRGCNEMIQMSYLFSELEL